MFNLGVLVLLLAVSWFVDAVPVVFKESTPNGESIVAISSSDPNVEKYLTQQFATRSGFTQLNTEEQNRDIYNQQTRPQDAAQSSFSITVPGKAIAGAGRSFASASSGPFIPFIAFPIASEGFDFNNFDIKDWVRNVESFYNPNFAGNSNLNTATAVNDNGHIYGNVNSVHFDNRSKDSKSSDKANNDASVNKASIAASHVKSNDSKSDK